MEEHEKLTPTERDDAAEPAGSEEPAVEKELDDATEREPEPQAPEPQDEGQDYLALAQRVQADFENYRKRSARDVGEAGKRARAGIVRELLPVVDNLERALASAPEGDPMAGGVKLVLSELNGVLERNGIEAFTPAGEQFDPTLHEALSTRPDEGAGAGVVLDVVEKGYRLNGSVLRPARVVVSA